MKSIISIALFLTTFHLTAQVGIGTTAPNASLDIRSSAMAAPVNTDGILIPQVDDFPASSPGANQDGMMVYATGVGTPAKGFYYWDNVLTAWVPMVGSAGGATSIDELSDGNSELSGSSVFLGQNSGSNDDGGNANVGLGLDALTLNTSGNSNVAIGNLSMSSNTTGFQNVGIGRFALRNNSDGDRNSALGYDALGANTTGGWNTAIGNIALFSNTSGERNTAIGFRALGSNTAGNNNTAVGYQALLQSTGAGNTAIGYYAGRNNPGSGGVFIGNNAGSNEANSNKLYIENSGTTTPLIYGTFNTNEVGINWDSAVALPNTLSVNGTISSSDGNIYNNSDRRLKKEVETIATKDALEKIVNLRGVTYIWNDTQTGFDRPETLQYGFIAQELMQVFPEKVTKDEQGFYQTAYGPLDAVFVQAIKGLKTQIQEKNERIEALENKLNSFEDLMQRIDTVEAKLNLLQSKDQASAN